MDYEAMEEARRISKDPNTKISAHMIKKEQIILFMQNMLQRLFNLKNVKQEY